LRPLLRFAQEASQRHVIRVAMAYLVGAWVTAQVGGLVFPIFGFHESALRALLGVLAAGLPVALWLAWRFDLTPEGVARTPSGPGSAGSDGPAPLLHREPAAVDRKSLAVLAFVDRSRAGADGFLAEGISEELINILGRAGGLKLAPRSSSFAFRSRDLDVREIGRRLNVAHVLDGSVRQSGEQLRISVELIDVAEGLTRWMNVYESESATLSNVQEDIAQRVVGQIAPAPSGGALPAIRVDHGTSVTEAYNLYLKGRVFWNSRYAVGLERSIECFGEAARLDPNYAPPLSGLADAYSLLAFYNFMAPRDGFGKASAFARRAQSLAPALAETNASLAFVQHFFDWNYGAAETSYRRAREADPDYGPSRFWFAFLLASIGRPDDAKAEIEAARKAEPYSSIINGGASYLDYFLGDHAVGIQSAATVLDTDPNFGPAHMFLGFHQIATGLHEEAVRSWRAAVERLDRLLFARLMLATAHAYAGSTAEARALLQQLDNSAQGYVSPYFRGIAALALGERDTALGLMEKALEDRCNFLVLAGLDPLLAGLREEPRFLRVIEQVGVPLQHVGAVRRSD
jgi:TolB-like protein